MRNEKEMDFSEADGRFMVLGDRRLDVVPSGLQGGVGPLVNAPIRMSPCGERRTVP